MLQESDVGLCGLILTCKKMMSRVFEVLYVDV